MPKQPSSAVEKLDLKVLKEACGLELGNYEQALLERLNHFIKVGEAQTLQANKLSREYSWRVKTIAKNSAKLAALLSDTVGQNILDRIFLRMVALRKGGEPNWWPWTKEREFSATLDDVTELAPRLLRRRGRPADQTLRHFISMVAQIYHAAGGKTGGVTWNPETGEWSGRLLNLLCALLNQAVDLKYSRSTVAAMVKGLRQERKPLSPVQDAPMTTEKKAACEINVREKLNQGGI
jgi:hypothetical protein